MSSILIPFARRIADGALVAPHEVSKGNKCGCVSLCCGLPVIARQGEKLIWHFAHERASDCEDGYDAAVRAMACHLLKQSRLLLLPEFAVEVAAVSARGHLMRRREVAVKQSAVNVDGFREESLIDGKPCPHLVGYVGDRQVLIDVTGLRTRAGERRKLLLSLGLPVLEIDCRNLGPEIPTKETLSQALFHSYAHKRWRFHPKAQAIRKELQGELDEELRSVAAQVEQERLIHAALQCSGSLHPAATTKQESDSPRPDGDIPQIGWRASLPSRDKVQRAIDAFRERHQIPLELATRVLGSVSSRGQLAGIAVYDLAAQWSMEMGVTPEDVLRHLEEAGYLLHAQVVHRR